MTGKLRQELGPWLVLIRVRSCFSGALLYAIGVLFDAKSIQVAPILLGCASMWSAVAQIDVVNDIADRDLDVVDKPERPLPSGKVSFLSATIASVVLAIVSLTLGFLAGISVLAGAIVLMLASVIYSWKLKSTLLAGNVLVAGAATVPFASGILISANASVVALLAEALLFTFMLAFEIVKTTADIKGDSAAGVMTVASRWGPGRALRLAAFFYLLSWLVAVSIAVYLRNILGMLFGVTFTFLVVLPAARRYYGRPAAQPIEVTKAKELFRTMQKAWKFGFVCLILLVLEFRIW